MLISRAAKTTKLFSSEATPKYKMSVLQFEIIWAKRRFIGCYLRYTAEIFGEDSVCH